MIGGRSQIAHAELGRPCITFRPSFRPSRLALFTNDFGQLAGKALLSFYCKEETFLWRKRSLPMWMKKLMMLCLTLLAFSGCEKKQHDVEVAPKPEQVPASSVPSSPAPGSEVPGEMASSAKPSEQQARALRRYNENAWFVHEAMQAAQLDGTLSAGISKLVKAATPDWDHANPSHWEIRGPEVATRLRPLLEIATKEKPVKQAAALLIADRIVVMEEENGNLEPQDGEKHATEGEPSGKHPKSAAQAELEKLGAQLSYEEGSERYFYTFSWLRRAYELEPKGRTSELAFLLLMGRGFETSPNCANGSEQFRKVIGRGKEFLRERHSADVEARVHLMMGDAYRDIVALGGDHHGDTYADPSKYKPEAADARTKAIVEYRAGLALDENSEPALIAKQRLRSLEAGEAPNDWRFYCEQME
jgi:hypothetical protein